MKFEKGTLVYNAHTGDKLYTVLGYNGAGGIILLPVGVEDNRRNRVVEGFDRWIYAKSPK